MWSILRAAATEPESEGRVTARISLKGCVRCHGDLRLDHDEYGPYQSCFQCGNTQYEQQEKSPRSVGHAKHIGFSGRHVRLPYVGDRKDLADRSMSVEIDLSGGGTSASRWRPLCVFCGQESRMQGQSRPEYRVVECPTGHRPHIMTRNGELMGWR